MQYYIELAGGKPSFHRNTFIPFDPIKIKEYIDKENNTDVYISICKYDDLDIINAKCIAPLVFDLDSEDDINLALEDAKWTVEELIKDGFDINDIIIYFSGNKGFHIIIPWETLDIEPTEELMKVYKKVAEKYIKKSPNKTIDTVIYEKRRIFRMPYSKHGKSGLYKNQITYKELTELSIDQIKEICKSKRVLKIDTKNTQKNIRFSKYLNSLKLLLDETESREYEQVEIIPDNQDIKIPNCIKKILSTPPGKGDRNNATFNLALFFKVNGYTQERTVNKILQWSGLKESEVKQTVDSAFKSSFKWGCGSDNEHIPKEFRGQCCMSKAKRISDDTFVKFTDIVDKTKGFLLDERKNTKLTTGYESIDELLSGVLDNDFIVLAAGVGYGKSLFAANMALVNAQRGNKVAFLSLEMINEQVVTRYVQNKTGIDNRTIASQTYTEIQKQQVKKAIEELKTEIPLYFFNREQIYTVDNIEKAIKKAIELYGLDMLIIDHLRYIGREGSSKEHEEIDKICTTLQRLSQRYNICIVLLAHYNKGDETKPREMTELLGSNAVYREATKILQIWRRVPRDDVEAMNMSEKDKLVRFICQKNRFGSTGVKLLSFDLKTQTFLEVDPRILAKPKEQNNREQMLDKILSQNHD